MNNTSFIARGSYVADHEGNPSIFSMEFEKIVHNSADFVKQEHCPTRKLWNLEDDFGRTEYGKGLYPTSTDCLDGSVILIQGLNNVLVPKSYQ